MQKEITNIDQTFKMLQLLTRIILDLVTYTIYIILKVLILWFYKYLLNTNFNGFVVELIHEIEDSSKFNIQ